MKFLPILLLATLVFSSPEKLFSQNGNDWETKISPELLPILEQGGTADLLIVLREQADVSGAKKLKSKTAKAQFVLNKLRETAIRTQVNLNRILHEKGAFANSFYLVNAISVENANLEIAQLTAQLPEVKYLSPDPEIHFPGPIFSGEEKTATTASGEIQNPKTENRNSTEWGIEMINAPAVWALGFTGQGITVGGADTGYEWFHPALQSHYRGWDATTSTADHNYNWHDAIHDKSPLNADSLNPCGFNSEVPCDDNSHGTHTMGTMTGDDNLGNQVGVAPGAKWIGCRNMERGWGQPSTYFECFQWFLAPTDLDGQNPDVARAPHVINNSWYCAVNEGCTDLIVNELLHMAVINLKASGVVVVVSNGNAGNGGQCFTTNDPPAYFEESFCVGATDEQDLITGFSSRGPIQIDGSDRNKPNVSAPGANVRSSVPGGNYAHFWGTSMAGPHVVGLVALVLSAAPELSGDVETIEDIVEATSVKKFDIADCGPNHLGSAIPNHAYGFGRVNALDAVNLAIAEVAAKTPISGELMVAVSPNPLRDKAVFELKNMVGEIFLRVFDASGRLVFSENRNVGHAEPFEVSTSNLSPGVYFWEISADGKAAFGKFFKQ